MRAKFHRELRGLGLAEPTESLPPVTEADLAALPEPARRYFRFMGAVGRPRDASLRAHWRGRFRRHPRERWMPCEAWQHNTREPIARIFHLVVRLGGLVPALGRDTYQAGRGRMLIRVLDRLTVVDAQGYELDTGELVTWLDDAILLAPSMALRPNATWTPVDADSFDVSVTDGGRTVAGRVFVDGRGAPVDFRTTDRFLDNPDPRQGRWLRACWSTPVEGWRATADGRMLPTRGQAMWRLPEEPFAYGDFELVREDTAFNVPAGD